MVLGGFRSFQVLVTTILSSFTSTSPLFAFLFGRTRKITHDNFEVNKWTLEKKVKCNNAKMTIDLCFPGVGCRVEGTVNIGIWEDYKIG